ncbi:hypothetical protein MMC07_000414 [Pseudocyphellaria aurata]|nr:hypothetical protein [Pseudocyphellaria aurata]
MLHMHSGCLQVPMKHMHRSSRNLQHPPLVSAQKLQSDTGLAADATFTADITDESLAGLTTAMQGVDALVISTSAKPQLVVSSLPKAAWRVADLDLLACAQSIWNKIRGASAMPDFYYNQMPEQVDWLGQKHQIDAAVQAGVKKVVLVSSMGGTKDKDYMLNKMGNGNILFWKRKAEQYLMQQQGIDYTIIHPGGLTDDKACLGSLFLPWCLKGGEREVLMGVDDELMEGEHRRIPRADVAELAVQSLYLPEASHRFVVMAASAGFYTQGAQPAAKFLPIELAFQEQPSSGFCCNAKSMCPPQGCRILQCANCCCLQGGQVRTSSSQHACLCLQVDRCGVQAAAWVDRLQAAAGLHAEELRLQCAA